MHRLRTGHGGGTRERTLFFCGIGVVCCVVYSTLSIMFSASRPPTVNRPHAWSVTWTPSKSQAQKKTSQQSVQEVDEQEVLVGMIRDFVSRSLGDKVDILRCQLHDILEESTQQDSAKKTNGTGCGDLVQRLRQQTTGSAGLRDTASVQKGTSEGNGVVEEERGLDKAEDPRGKEEERGVDLLSGIDSNHRPKIADEEEGLLRRVAEHTVKCRKWKSQHKVVAGVTWGDLPPQLQEEWSSIKCDEYPPVDCTTSAENGRNLPLVAIMAGATTRKVKNVTLSDLALFRHLIPSIVRTVECGFRYLMVVGYDLGDPFYDSKDGQTKVHTWFEANIQAKLSPVNLKIELLLVAVDNTLQKPGPVFLEMARAAYKQGAQYFYRVNDDTELLNPWVVKFVSSLEDMGFPYGAVGPLCRQGNTKILTHDFTHRTHMEIFDGEYYPPQLTDWWMDDWMARTYGSSRTRQSKTVEVTHHTSAHGQRYDVDSSNEKLLNGLVHKGRDRIYAYMRDKGVDQDEMARFNESRFDSFPLEDIAVAAVAQTK